MGFLRSLSFLSWCEMLLGNGVSLNIDYVYLDDELTGA
jgi:hypothetical protein